MGFTKNNRFEMFVERCAPIQINYLGYSGTLGSKCIDYIIGDKILISKNNQKNYSEKIINLPGSFMINDSNKKHYRNCECFLLDARLPKCSSAVYLADR